jgi:ABC-type branched-subunit amino acid transport system ATPase component/predicted MFS family arabinose efflux permease
MKTVDRPIDAEDPQRGAPTPTPTPGRARQILHDLRPSVVTHGASALPLVLLAFLSVMDGWDTSAAGVLLPEIRDYFGVSIALITLANSLGGVLTVLLAIPLGYFADRWNRVWMTVVATLVFGVFALFTGIAWTFFALAAFRFGAGVGKTVGPVQQSLLADYYPPGARGAVFSFHQLGNRLGTFIGPLVAGGLASIFVWQVPFLVFGLPAVVLAAVMALKLREPVRGEQERRSLGLGEEAALTGEAPPSWTESWRIAKSVRTLRRFWWALPFLVASEQVIVPITALFYKEIFGLGPAARGTIAAFEAPVAMAGLIVGGAFVNRFLRYRPGRVITGIGLLAVIIGLCYIVVALAPVVWLAIAFRYLAAFLGALVAPALIALMTMVIPPRARGFALSVGAWFLVPGLALGPLLGGIADRAGLRVGLLLMTPIYMVGALIITSAGTSVDADVRAAQAASAASYVARQSKREGKAKLLVVRDLDVHYDQVQILFNLDFEVDDGEIIALLGTNGAGKSTLLRAVSGLTPASNGAIFFDGEDITFLPPSAHAARGIIQVPGGRGVFPNLTVAENLKLACWLFRRDDAYVSSATEAVLDRFPALRNRLGATAGDLSGGEQQMLTLGQAFLSRPRLLMIDELSLGLAPAIVEQLLGIVKDIAALGTTIILVEQSVNVALTVARRAVFMEKGEIRFTGPTSELLARPDILRSVYLKGAGGGGGSIASYGAQRSIQAGPAGAPANALEIRGVSKRYGGVQVLDDVDITLEEGKVLGLIGPNGAGKTTLFDVISGFVPPNDGEILLFGEDVTALAADQRAALGLVRSFQDARLFPSLTVTENIAVALEQQLEAKSTIGAALHLPNVRKAEQSIGRRIDRLIRLMNLDDFRDKFVRELSTGSRRIVDLACVMACDPKVLLLDEPSSGIAQREAEELGALLQRIRWETGCSVLIIEHDMNLISSVADELLALDLGQVVTRGLATDVLAHPQVVASYLGTSEEVINRSGDPG